MMLTTPPLLSVIIPVYNVALYLEACVKSVLSQGFHESELEIILVNDGSTDGSGLLCEKLARRHSNINVVTKRNAGLSAARNTGLDVASGDHIVFLDSDDVVPDGVYQRMLARLMQSGSDFITGPAYRFASWKRHAWPFDRNFDLFTKDATGLTFAENPEFVRDFTAWNKIYRTDFFRSTRVRFPEGRIYEDVATTPIIYAQARAFDVFADPAYFWRITPGSITQTVRPAKALDRLWALEQVLEYLRSIQASDRIMAEFGFALVDYNLRWIFLEYRRFDASTQKQIRNQSHELLNSIDPKIVESVGEPLKTWMTLARGGSFDELHTVLSGYQEFEIENAEGLKRLKVQATKFSARLRHHVNTWSRRIKHLFLYLLLRPMMFFLPLQHNTAVVSNYWGNKFSRSDGPAVIALKILEQRPDMHVRVFASRAKHAEIIEAVRTLSGGNPKITVIVNESIRYYVALWRAKYLFNDVNFQLGFRVDKFVKKRRGQIEVQTTHGIPLKKMGLDSVAAIDEEELPKFLAKSSRYSYLVSSSEKVARSFAAAHGTQPTILQTGLPQHDDLFTNITNNQQRDLQAKYGLDPDKKTIVYAPTFRHDRGYAFRFLLDVLHLAKEVGDDYQLVINMHPFNHIHLGMTDFAHLTDLLSTQPRRAFVKLFGEVRIDPAFVPVSVVEDDVSTPAEVVHRTADINELMRIADVVVTDYSSLMFGYIHLKKPLILFTPDSAHYDATRGSYYHVDTIAPGAVAKSTEEIVRFIRLSEDHDAWNQTYGPAIATFRSDFLAWEQGNAASKILAQIGLTNK